MKLSIIIPVYNGESTILRCLDSIFRQDIKDGEIEVLVIDDCSTDRTSKIVGEYITPPII